MLIRSGMAALGVCLNGCISVPSPRPFVAKAGAPLSLKGLKLNRYDLLALAQGYRMRQNPGNDRPLYALPAVFQQCSVQTGAGQPSDAVVKAALTSIDTGGDFSSSTLQSAPDFFHFDNPEQYAHAFGLGVQTLAVVGSVLDPPAALTLGVLSVFAEDAWRAAAQGRDLLNNPWIEPAPSLDRTCDTEALLRAAAEAHDIDPTFGQVIDSPLLRAKVGVDFSAPAESSFAALPASTQSLVEAALSSSETTDNPTSTGNDQVVGKILDRLSTQCSQLEQQAKSYQDLLSKEAAEHTRQAQREQLASLQSEVQSSIRIATFVLGHILGDSQVASQLGTAMSQIASVGFQFASGNYLGAVATSLDLFSSGGQSPSAAILQAISQLGTRIENLRKEMNARFDQLEANDQEIINQLAELLRDVQQGTVLLASRIEALQEEVEFFKKQEDEDNRRKANTEVKTAFQQFSGTLAAKDSGWETFCRNQLALFFSSADSDSRDSYFCGSVDGATPGQIAIEVRTVGRAELLVGLLPTICRQMGVPCTSNVVSPFAWAFGVEAYLQSDLLLGTVTNSAREDNLTTLFQDGADMRACFESATSDTLLKALATAHRNSVGAPENPSDGTVLALLKPLISQWEAHNLNPPYTKDVLASGHDYPETVYVPTFLDNKNEIYRIHNSPFEAALKLGIIELQPFKDFTYETYFDGTLREIDYAIVPKIGPDSGKVFGGANGGSLQCTMPINNNEAKSWIWNPMLESLTPVIPTYPQFGLGTLSFLDYCEKLLGFYYATKVVPQLESWLRSQIATPNVYASWADIASSAALCITLAQWRKIDGPEVDGQTDLRNVGILKNLDALIDWIGYTLQNRADTINASPSTTFDSADPRPLDTLALISNRLSSDATLIESSGNALREAKSAPIIDTTIRRLAGYMVAKGIKVPVPPREATLSK